MSSNLQQSPYLREQRNFPNDNLNELAGQVDQSYIDIAQKVNARTIGLFGSLFQIITGERWYLEGSSQGQQTLRQVYAFGAIAPGAEVDLPTGITNLVQFTRIYGTCITAVPDYRPLPYIDNITLNVGITLLVGIVGGKQQIRIVNGAGAPAITSGIVVLEWLSLF